VTCGGYPDGRRRVCLCNRFVRTGQSSRFRPTTLLSPLKSLCGILHSASPSPSPLHSRPVTALVPNVFLRRLIPCAPRRSDVAVDVGSASRAAPRLLQHGVSHDAPRCTALHHHEDSESIMRSRREEERTVLLGEGN